MSSHSEMQLRLYEFLRDKLPAEDRATMEGHIASCKECASELESLREALDLLPARAAAPSEERSSEFWNSFASKIMTEAAPQKRSQRNPLGEFIDWIEESLLLRPRRVYALGG